MHKLLTLVFAAFLIAGIAQFVTAKEWQSGAEKVTLVELYTSEGCSSCPPADRWLSQLKQHPQLFKKFVPVAFHVDYWDWIGWEDRFADKAYSERQREYVRQGLVAQVYTPGFVVDNSEWRAWFRGDRKLPTSPEKAGNLRVKLEGSSVSVDYSQKQALQLHVAVLGMGLSTEVSAGENSGRELKHDFVVLDFRTKTGKGTWQLDLPGIPDVGQQRSALAVWVGPIDSQRVFQAFGGYL